MVKKYLHRALSLAGSGSAKSTYILFTGNIADSVFAFLFTLITFRLLTSSDFGIFSAINNLVFTAVLILDLGIGSGLLFFIPRCLNSSDSTGAWRYLNSGLFLRLVISAAASLVIVVFSPFLARTVFRTPQIGAVMVAGLAIITISLLDILNYSLQAKKQFLHSAIASNTFSLLRFLLACLPWIFAWKFSLLTVETITFLAPVLGIILSLNWLGIRRLNVPSANHIRSLVGFSGWLGVYKIASTVTTRLDVPLVLVFLGPSLTGIYSVAARLANFYPVIFISLTAVLASRFSVTENITNLKVYLQKAFLGITCLAAAMLFGAMIAPWLVPALFGIRAAEAVIYFRGLTLAYLPALYTIIPLSLLIYHFKSPKWVGILGLLQVLVVIGGNLIFTPLFGLSGPVGALGLANTLVLFLSLYIVKRSWK